MSRRLRVAIILVAVLTWTLCGSSTSNVFATFNTSQPASSITQPNGLMNEKENVKLQTHHVKASLTQAYYPEGISRFGSTNTTITNANVTVIGSILLREDATLRFENSVIRVIVDPLNSPNTLGDITLQDRAKLSLNNCSLLIKKDLRLNYQYSGSIQLSEESRLIAQDTNISSTEEMSIQCNDDSHLSLYNVIYAGVAPRSSIHYGIEDYTFENILQEFHDSYYITGIDHSTISLTGSRIGKIATYGNSTLTVDNSEITYYYESRSSEKAILTNSRVKMYYLPRYNNSITLSVPLEKFHDEWDSAQFYPNDLSLLGDRFVESSIDNVWLSLYNCDAELRDTKLKILAAYGGTLSVTGCSVWLLEAGFNTHSKIIYSNIEYMLGYSDENLDLALSHTELTNLLLTTKEEMRVSVTDSKVENSYINHRWWTPRHGEINFTRTNLGNMKFSYTILDLIPSRETNMNFDDCLLTGNLTIQSVVAESDRLILSGSLRFGPKTLASFEPAQMITRIYIVGVYNEGEPLKRIPLRLMDGNRTIWEGMTDENGSASFSIDFVNRYDAIGNHIYNMTAKYILGAEFEEETFSSEVGLLSDTPIQIAVRKSQWIKPWMIAATTILLLLVAASLAIRRSLSKAI